MLSGDIPKAIDAFDLALDLDPNLGEAKLNRAIAWLRTDQEKRAIEHFEALAGDKDSPLRASAAYHAALAHEALGKNDAALKWVEQALALQPEFDDAVLFSGLLYERRGDFQEAGKRYKTYVDRNPQSQSGHLRFGTVALRAGYAPAAKKSFQRVIELAPQSIEAVEARKFLVMVE